VAAVPESDGQKGGARTPYPGPVPHHGAPVSKAVDMARAQEAKELKDKGYGIVLTKTHWLQLERPENLTDNQETMLAGQYNLRSIRSHLLKEEFQLFWW
jgi:hypothetical protein